MAEETQSIRKQPHDRLVIRKRMDSMTPQTVADASIPAGSDRQLLEIRNLKLEFGSREKPLQAVDDVSFSIRSGETVCVVGESGCGKSVTALSIARLVPS